ncbi:hypothetical protein FBU31_002026 [Coemansia sp. 'formosensis']|nr:hypothetical protein FBU31_002026 [Coemansia sp. 'formosensis']
MPPAMLLPEAREDQTLTFKTLKAPMQKFTLRTSSVRTVAQVKRHLARVSNIPVGSMRLVLGGKGLVDTKLIGDYAIPENAVIQIVSKAPAAGEAAETLAADGANPLSNILNQENEMEVVEEETVESMAAAAGEMDGDDGPYNYLTEETRERLGDSESEFRANLRKFLKTQFSKGQAQYITDMLDRTLNDFAMC